MKKTKFKVELEIEVEYNMDDGVTPYTSIQAWVEKDIACLKTTAGKIVDMTPLTMTRVEDKVNNE